MAAIKTRDQRAAEREDQILEYMKQYISEKGYPPTVRDICTALNIKSTSTVHKAMAGLEEKGKIRKQAGRRRALDVVKDGPETGGASGGDGLDREDVVDIPVIGRIAAGTPILAEQNVEDSFPVPSRFLGKGKNFMLTVHGESMIEAGIFDGDYILVQQQETANNGDIVVAMIDGMEAEATVKAFYRENGHIRLQPRNSSMEPIIVQDAKILGLVKGVFRYFS